MGSIHSSSVSGSPSWELFNPTASGSAATPTSTTAAANTDAITKTGSPAPGYAPVTSLRDGLPTFHSNALDAISAYSALGGSRFSNSAAKANDPSNNPEAAYEEFGTAIHGGAIYEPNSPPISTAHADAVVSGMVSANGEDPESIA